MDYEKKYNEALERARALWREAIEKEYVNDYLKDYETIFPELRESEDERIRKDLIYDIVRLPMQGVLTHRPTSEYIAYLEKQKEPENVSASTMAPSCWETKQMPADWTDKDKRILDDVSHLLIMLNYKDMARAYKQAIEKLIYQHHWKPSDEQMEALRKAVNKLAKTDVADSVRLSIMYDNLKKL